MQGEESRNNNSSQSVAAGAANAIATHITPILLAGMVGIGFVNSNAIGDIGIEYAAIRERTQAAIGRIERVQQQIAGIRNELGGIDARLRGAELEIHGFKAIAND